MYPSIVGSVHPSSMSSQKNSTYNDGQEWPFKVNVLPCILHHSTYNILKLQRTKISVSVDHLFMTIFPYQVVPRAIPMFDSLSEPWCYQNTRFTISCLKTIYTRLDIPNRIYIQQGHAHCSSEYAFIVMCVKLATGMTTI
jgi:hypothetical protein